MLTRHLPLGALLALLPQTALAQDVVIHSDTTVRYDTSLGTLDVGSLVIEPGGVLEVFGPEPLRLVARRGILIDGLLDVSGSDAVSVLTLNTTNQPEIGAAGGPGGGNGGIGSRRTNMSTEDGSAGLGTGSNLRGGRGGETGYQFITGDADERRGAGGGGGALAADQPVNTSDLDAPENIGLIARSGVDGSAMALGAKSGSSVPRGGASSEVVFVDADPLNDFFGRRADAGGVVVGELAAPLAGRGGGGGGDSVRSATFPLMPFTVTGDEKGAGGGGGGGLGILMAPVIIVGSSGEVRADGGAGGGGENTFFFNQVGGGSGGGSGGMLILQARRIDLRNASANAITALGGVAGTGRNQVRGAVGAGGDGGPGIIQLHVPDAQTDLLLGGAQLDDLTSPNAYVLLPEPGL